MSMSGTILAILLASVAGAAPPGDSPGAKKKQDAPPAAPPQVGAPWEAFADLFQLDTFQGKVRLVVVAGEEVQLYTKSGDRYGDPKVLFPLTKARKKGDEASRTIRAMRFRQGAEGDLHLFLEIGQNDPPRSDVLYGRFTGEGKPRHSWFALTDTGSPKDTNRYVGSIWKSKDVLCVVTTVRQETKTGPNSFSSSNSRELVGLLAAGKYKVVQVLREYSWLSYSGILFGTSEKDIQVLGHDGPQLVWSALDRYQPRLATSSFEGDYPGNFTTLQAKDGLVYSAVELRPEKKLNEPRLWVGSGKVGKALEPHNLVGMVDAPFLFQIHCSFSESPDGKVYLFAGVAKVEEEKVEEKEAKVKPDDGPGDEGEKKDGQKKDEAKQAGKVLKALKTRIAWWNVTGKSLPEARFVPGLEVWELRQLQVALKDPRNAEIVWKEGSFAHARSFALE
jgi:hypothetical protein